MNGILDHAPLDTRVACVREVFERIEVDSQKRKASPLGRQRSIRVLIGRMQ